MMEYLRFDTKETGNKRRKNETSNPVVKQRSQANARERDRTHR